jgi:tetratricopeptide (TPR) repeat protein
VTRKGSGVGRLAIILVCLLAPAAGGQTRPSPEAQFWQRLHALEAAIAANPEDLELAADYRQLTVGAKQFDRAIEFLEKLAKPKGSGPNIQLSLALAYIDKVPTSGDIRRLYLGRDAVGALTQSIARRPSVLAYYVRGLVNLYYNNFIFHRTDRGVADLTQALSMAAPGTPPKLVAKLYTALGDGYFRLENIAKAREMWSLGAAKFPEEPALQERLNKHGTALEDVVTTSLSAGRRVDTSLANLLQSQ